MRKKIQTKQKLPLPRPEARPGKKIFDEFTDLPVSRARKNQLRRQRDGLCSRCDEPRVTKDFCVKHAEAHKVRLLKYARDKAKKQKLIRAQRSLTPPSPQQRGKGQVTGASQE